MYLEEGSNGDAACRRRRADACSCSCTLRGRDLMMLLLLVGAPGCRPLYHVFIGPASCSTCLFRASDLTRGAACQLGGTRMNAHGKAEPGRDGKGEWRAGRAEPGNEETRAESIAGGACARCWSVPGHPTGSALLRSGLQRINGRVAEPSHPTTRHGDLVASGVSVPLRFLFQSQFQSSAGGPPDACLAVDNTHNSPNTDSVHDLCACRRLHPYTTQDRPTETQCRLRWMLPSRLRWLGWVMCPPSVLDALVLKAAQQQPSHKTSLFLLW